MTPQNPLEWLRAVNPQVLNSCADTFNQVGTNLENLFTRYQDAVTQVNGTHWEGESATAAQSRAGADLTTMQTLRDKLDAMATRARQGYFDIDTPLQKARGILTEISNIGLVAGPFLIVNDTTETSDDAKERKSELQADLQSYARTAMAADGTVRDALNAARVELVAAFTSAATLGVEQGKNDGQQLVTDPSQLSDVALRRLVEAGQLTPEQITALQLGDKVMIPASQMEYLNTVARSLDGKSPQEIKAIMDKLPPDARAALTNSLELISTETVTTGVKGDAGIPEHGGGNLLPDKIQQALTRKDLVEDKWTAGIGYGGLHTIGLNGVADTKAITSIVAAGDPQYKAGSALDRGLLDVGRQYLDAQNNFEQKYADKGAAFTVDGVGTSDRDFTEGIFAAVGDDKVAVQSMVTGEHGKEFVLDVMNHDWTDDGKGASTLFQFGDRDATVENPGDRLDETTATRMGNIMSAVGQAVSTDEAWATLSDMPGADGQSSGQLNPDLMSAVAGSMSPYVADLAGGGRDDVRGFETPRTNGNSWIDPAGNGSYVGAKNVFALMNTSDESGKLFTNEAMTQILANEKQFALDPHDASTSLRTAGRIDGLIDAGLLQESLDDNDDAHDAAMDAYERKQQWFDLGSGLTGMGVEKIPVGGELAWTVIDSQMDPIKDSIIGAEPQPTSTTLTAPDVPHRHYDVLSQANISPELQQKYPALFDNGTLKPWDTLNNAEDYETNRTLIGRLLDDFDGDPAINGGDELINSYRTIIDGAGARPDGGESDI